MAAQAAELRPRTVWTRAEVAKRIAQGEVLVLRRGLIYRLNSWVHKHPGGELAILHFVGRDARDEIEVYHSEETVRTLMARFVVARLAEEDDTDVAAGRVYRPLVPPVQLGFRDGQLDHPHAQLDARREAHAGGAVPHAATRFPLPVELLEPPPPPPRIVPLREARISAAFSELHDRVKAAGLYELRPHNYARECVRYVCAGLLSIYFFRLAGQLEGGWKNAAYVASAAFLGALWHQVTFTAHDAGHTGITHVYWLDRLLGVVVASYLGGLSLIWWCDNHDVHHLVTNHPEHDPDIQHMPIFAISPVFVRCTRLLGGTQADEKRRDAAQDSDAPAGAEGADAAQDKHAEDAVAEDAVAAQDKHAVDADAQDRDAVAAELAEAAPIGLWSSYYRRLMPFDAAARFLLRNQHKLYYLIMSLARFNLYALSYGFLLTRARRDRWLLIEGTGLIFFWFWFIRFVLGNIPDWRMRLVYMLVSHVVTSPLHVQIVLSHFAQDTSDLGVMESFPSRQVRTTMDVSCPKYLDFFHGGLHMQVAHHLFPRLPRHNLRECRDRFVVPFCEEWGLHYDEMTFVPGNRKVLSRLLEVANQVRVLACVADAQAKGELH